MYKATNQIKLESLIDGSKHFKWKEALWVPSWEIFCFPSDEQYMEIVRTAKLMDIVRELLGNKQINVTSWLRPRVYNGWPAPYGVGGAKASSHMEGKAVDFIVTGMASAEARQLLKPHLERYKFRLEANNTPHVHVDRREPGGGGRFFMA